VLYLLCGEIRQESSEKVNFLTDRKNEQKQISRSRLANSANLTIIPQALASNDPQSYGNYREDMKDGKDFLPVPGDIQRPMKVQCSDTVSWGRLGTVEPSAFYLVLSRHSRHTSDYS
jgi:hypothetical protein